MTPHFLLAALALIAIPAAAQDSPELRTYKQTGAVALKAHVFVPDRNRDSAPAVLLFHGGGWQAGSPEWTYATARLLQAEGLVAIAIEYRLSEGDVTPADALADACDAFAWTRDHAAGLGIDPDRVAGYGVSAGGHLVAAAGVGACGDRPGPNLVLLKSPALDLERDGWFVKLMRGGDVRAVSPLALADHGGPPTAIIQGEKDTLTPIASARAFCEKLIAAGGVCQLNAYPGLGHLLTRNLANQESDFDVDPEAVRDANRKIAAFLRARGYIRD